ncbi:hypothetical protein HK100_011197 [Physocladia obscura]|uniref:Uncharacterized protein n=1 Tax=Physocladia obscura TaxID=109957 RepID=A0AAD5T1K5_9FUNG|nr:hypothetical protein HK100_011197 [Physocladia obscura]
MPLQSSATPAQSPTDSTKQPPLSSEAKDTTGAAAPVYPSALKMLRLRELGNARSANIIANSCASIRFSANAPRFSSRAIDCIYPTSANAYACTYNFVSSFIEAKKSRLHPIYAKYPTTAIILQWDPKPDKYFFWTLVLSPKIASLNHGRPIKTISLMYAGLLMTDTLRRLQAIRKRNSGMLNKKLAFAFLTVMNRVSKLYPSIKPTQVQYIYFSRYCLLPLTQDIFVTATRDGSIKTWDVRCTGMPVGDDYIQKANHEISSAHIGPNYNPGKKKVKIPSINQSVTGVQFLIHNSNLLASSGASDGLIKFWDLRSKLINPVETSKPQGSSPGICSLSLHPNGSKLYAACKDQSVHEYSTSFIDAPIRQFTSSTLKIDNFFIKTAISPDGSAVACGSSDSCVQIWDLSKGGENRLPVLLKGHEKPVTAIGWSNTTFEQISSCSDDFTTRIWNVRQPKNEKEERNGFFGEDELVARHLVGTAEFGQIRDTVAAALSKSKNEHRLKARRVSISDDQRSNSSPETVVASSATSPQVCKPNTTESSASPESRMIRSKDRTLTPGSRSRMEALEDGCSSFSTTSFSLNTDTCNDIKNIRSTKQVPVRNMPVQKSIMNFFKKIDQIHNVKMFDNSNVIVTKEFEQNTGDDDTDIILFNRIKDSETADHNAIEKEDTRKRNPIETPAEAISSENCGSNDDNPNPKIPETNKYCISEETILHEPIAFLAATDLETNKAESVKPAESNKTKKPQKKAVRLIKSATTSFLLNASPRQSRSPADILPSSSAFTWPADLFHRSISSLTDEIGKQTSATVSAPSRRTFGAELCGSASNKIGVTANNSRAESLIQRLPTQQRSTLRSSETSLDHMRPSLISPVMMSELMSKASSISNILDRETIAVRKIQNIGITVSDNQVSLVVPVPTLQKVTFKNSKTIKESIESSFFSFTPSSDKTTMASSSVSRLDKGGTDIGRFSNKRRLSNCSSIESIDERRKTAFIVKRPSNPLLSGTQGGVSNDSMGLTTQRVSKIAAEASFSIEAPMNLLVTKKARKDSFSSTDQNLPPLEFVNVASSEIDDDGSGHNHDFGFCKCGCVMIDADTCNCMRYSSSLDLAARKKKYFDNCGIIDGASGRLYLDIGLEQENICPYHYDELFDCKDSLVGGSGDVRRLSGENGIRGSLELF